jgi:multiple sugar transport system substrate-binding protein
MKALKVLVLIAVIVAVVVPFSASAQGKQQVSLWFHSGQCEAPDGAWAFIEHLMQPENVKAMTDANGAVPSRLSVLAADARFAEGGDMYIYVQQLEGGVALPRPATTAYPAIQTGMSDAINALARGEDVQATLDSAVDTIDAMIATLSQ